MTTPIQTLHQIASIVAQTEQVRQQSIKSLYEIGDDASEVEARNVAIGVLLGFLDAVGEQQITNAFREVREKKQF